MPTCHAQETALRKRQEQLAKEKAARALAKKQRVAAKKKAQEEAEREKKEAQLKAKRARELQIKVQKRRSVCLSLFCLSVCLFSFLPSFLPIRASARL